MLVLLQHAKTQQRIKLNLDKHLWEIERKERMKSEEPPTKRRSVSIKCDEQNETVKITIN